MITIRPAVPEELPQLKDLWRKCFGDPSTYVDIFYQKFCPVEQVLVVDEVGELDSMAAMLPGTVHLPDGTDIPVGYVYALATNPYMQGKGHARQLLKYADEYLQKRGDKAMILVPASPSLHRFFETVGMDECFATRKVEFLASSLTGDTGGGVMTPVAPREYNEIRERYLKDTFHVTYSDNMITFQQIGSHMAYGDLYKI
ncbi:MAG: GNAT family N-acetyltransferase, partial [Clostridiales bacterium]|nr:GNAT family N-acetyltransferase [Clostridiales bacterium]